LGLQLATIHNLAYYSWLMREARQAILADRFQEWKTMQLHALS
jgi:queuine tRNA-ribosyltransferase